jgi:hypothetical protein
MNQVQELIQTLSRPQPKSGSYREYIRRNSNFHTVIPVEYAKEIGSFFPYDHRKLSKAPKQGERLKYVNQ